VRLLVSGTERYLGCLLAPVLLEDGHHVVADGRNFWKGEPR
jgi:hypothetical protein